MPLSQPPHSGSDKPLQGSLSCNSSALRYVAKVSDN